MQTSVQLVGRESEARALRLAVAEHRVVVVHGPAGVGKSRLVRDTLPDAVHCPLGAARTEEEVLLALAESLEAPAGEEPTALIHRLASRSTPIVVLDGVDGLVDQLGAWLPRWSSVRGEPRFVLTVCGAAELAGVSVSDVRVDPLELSHALAMWTDTARRLGSPSDAELAREIVERLDRLPLAIEWMASQAAVVGEAACLDRLRRYSTNEGPLSAALEAVLEDLGPDEDRALAEISAFERGALAPVLDALLGANLGSVGSLMQRSLLRIDRLADGMACTSTYRLVAARMRKRGQAEGTWDAHLRAHANAVLRIAEPLAAEIEGPLEQLAHHRVELEAIAERFETADGDLALRACLALAPLALRDEGSAVTADRLRRMMDQRASVSDEVHVTLAALERRLGRFDRARAQLDALREPSFRAVLERAHVDRMQSRSAEAQAGYERALEMAERKPDATQRCIALGELGRMLQSRGRFEAARGAHQQAVGLARALGLGEREALERSLYARATHRAGKVREAIALHEQALELHRTLGHERLVAAELGHLGFCHHELDEPHRGEALFRECIEGLAKVGDVMLEAIERILLARLLADVGRGAEGKLELGLAEGVLEQSDVPRIRLTLHLVAGQIELQAGELGAARRQLQQGMEHGEHVEVGFEALLPAYLAWVSSQLGANDEAKALLRPARTLEAALEPPGLRAALAMLSAAADGRPITTPAPDVLEASSDARRVFALVGGAGEPERTLRVTMDGRSVRLPDGETFEFGRRAAPRRLMLELCRAREAEPDTALDADQLIAVGWPGERMQTEAARKRLRTAIWTLRKLGLEGILLTRDDGYLLDPHTPFAWAS